ncbi:MAG: hypothetical protein ABWX62_02775, partial [Microterricola sp.]
GVESPQQNLRVAPDGGPAAGTGAAADWPSVSVSPDERVWIERSGAAHANDAMVLERFALAVGVLRARRRSVADDPVQLVIDAARPEQERAAAAARIRIDDAPVRVVATPPAVRPTGPSTLIATAHGVVRATIVSGNDQSEHAPAGLGSPGTAAQLPASWSDALLALRLVDDAHQRVDAAAFGVLLPAVRSVEAETGRHPDVAALSNLDARSASTLAALVEAESVRAAAGALGMHHSSLQARHAALSRELGYDPRSPLGRARYQLAALLLRLERRA